MPIALTGALVGVALALFLFIAEYLMLRSSVAERAQRLHRKPEFDQTERKRIMTLLRFCVFIPPVFALFAWIIWG